MQDTDLPQYDAIKAEHVVPGIRTLLTQLNRWAPLDPETLGGSFHHLKPRLADRAAADVTS